MFGRNSARTATPDAGALTTSVNPDQAKKGRPTPSRRQAEAKNQHSIVTGDVLRPNATKAERKAARAAQKNQATDDRTLSRERMLAGDERYLMKRDQGPARAWTRDYVDARRNVGDYTMIAIFALLAISIVRAPAVQLLATWLIILVFAAFVLDGVWLARHVKRATAKRFGSQSAGTGWYAVMRTTQFRRWRVPRPRVARGQYPD